MESAKALFTGSNPVAASNKIEGLGDLGIWHNSFLKRGV